MEPNTIELIKIIGTIIGSAIALVTVTKGVLEYGRQGALRRAEYFRELRTRFKDREEFERLRSILSEGDEDALAEIPFSEKKEFLSFLEEVALAVNSKLLNEDVAHYMFGYYAAKIHESKNFWKSVSKNHWSWKISVEFCERMASKDTKINYDTYKF